MWIPNFEKCNIYPMRVLYKIITNKNEKTINITTINNNYRDHWYHVYTFFVKFFPVMSLHDWWVVSGVPLIVLNGHTVKWITYLQLSLNIYYITPATATSKELIAE